MDDRIEGGWAPAAGAFGAAASDLVVALGVVNPIPRRRIAALVEGWE
jgi:hypothetical protein